MTLSSKLASFINGQMTDFLTQVAEKHSIDINTLLGEWESFTGLKPKVKKLRLLFSFYYHILYIFLRSCVISNQNGCVYKAHHFMSFLFMCLFLLHTGSSS